MFSRTAAAVVAFLGLFQQTYGQCANNVAVYNPNVRTMSTNTSIFVVPVPKAAVQSAVNAALPGKNLKLLDVPTSDKTLFPNGFPAGMHPVIGLITYSADIRMSALQIDGPLINGGAQVPYVGKDGSSAPLQVALSNYIAGENGPLPNGLVPAVASPLLFAGNPIRLGQFLPEDAAYMSDAAGTLTAECKWALVPNPVSGPGVYPEVVDLLFKSASTSKYTPKTFKALINQPIILPSGMCQRNAYYFNNATALPSLRNGQVTFGPGSDGVSATQSKLMQASPDGSGVYTNVDGYSACAQNVGNNPENCDQASANTDPNTLK